MARSAVLTGRIDARDRAKLRHRLDRTRPSKPDPYDALWTWLTEANLGGKASSELAKIDLGQFVRDTGAIDLPPQERLRQLAIHLEERLIADFAAIDRVYEAALRLEPRSFLVWHSRGITAKAYAVDLGDPQHVARFRKLALSALYEAHELAPSDAGVTHSIGKWHYELGSVTDALPWFDRALAIDPNHGWARLYRAHCLHDMQTWPAAVDAYADVPLETFKGRRAYFVDVVLEAQAYCKMKTGDRAGAIADFERLLTRLEKQPKQAELLLLKWLSRACDGPLRDSLGDRYRAFARLAGLT